ILGRSVRDVPGREAYDAMTAYVEHVLSGSAVEFDVEIPYPHAGQRFMRVAFEPDGKGGWVAALSDVTEHRRAQSAIEESENRFRTMAESAPLMIWMAGTDKGCTYLNQTWLDFTGRTLDEQLGNGWAENVHPEDRKRCLDTYNSAFDACQEFEMEYRLRRLDGVYRWVVSKGVPRFSSGDFIGYIGTCMDV